MDYYCSTCFQDGSSSCDNACPRKGCKGRCDIRVPSATETELKAAQDAIWRDYRNDVVGLALDVARSCKAGEVTDLSDAIHEAADGSQRVIYTYQAKLGLLATDNEDAWEDLGFVAPTAEQRMYCALVQDIREELERWGVDENSANESDEVANG